MKTKSHAARSAQSAILDDPVHSQRDASKEPCCITISAASRICHAEVDADALTKRPDPKLPPKFAYMAPVAGSGRPQKSSKRKILLKARKRDARH